ncbi:hypothetical protein MTR_5g029460 [Medicago truncatula]|uniref:Protein FAR1-RELATED SEQUENCE n=1 Tax=Medicago truncatula TaxID=3880 RepID=G7KCD7_MEDTR|nr:hypothetical protein MTR_5g029460 [Medicago truncatula]
MNAVPSVFPNITALYCYFHVGKNVRAKCINDCRGKPKDEKIVRAWKDRVLHLRCRTDDRASYDILTKEQSKTGGRRLRGFLRRPCIWNNIPCSLRCPCAWYRFRPSRTNNRFEGAHGKLKKYLRNCVGYLVTCWEEIHNMLDGQLTEIHASFGRSSIVLEHRYTDNVLYSGFEVYVSRADLSFMF